MSDLAARLQTALAGRYRIERPLGHGGMATVFLAEDLKHHRQVALKVLDPEVAAAIGPERFEREIETAARLSHPHILPLHDSGVADGLLFYVMPYVAGESLRQRLEREKQLPVGEAVRLAREIAGALDHAHGQGIVHRDIKPENVLLQDGHAVVADFGIARAAAAGGERLTATGVSVGTPAYMSPEQAAGSREVDARSDQYALGCVVYEMLAGVPPFSGPTPASLSHQHLNVVARPVTDLRPLVPAAMREAVARGLAKLPADRFASAGAFAAALAAAHEPSGTTPVPGAARPARRGRMVALSAAAVVVVALVAVAAWQRWGPFGGGAAKPAGRRDWLLVAEFDGPTADSATVMATHDLLSAALDQSSILQTVPRSLVRDALRAAGKPSNTRLDAELAREIATRSAVRAVLEGRVGRLGSAYTIVVDVVNADSGRVILNRSVTAKDERALIGAVEDLGRQLRKAFGENGAALRATRSMNLVMTPSFEAYRLYVQGNRTYASGGGLRRAMAYYRAALAADTAFASAWAALAGQYGNFGLPDSVEYCIERAYRHPERLTESQKQLLERTRMWNAGDVAGVLAYFDRILAEDASNYGALANSNDALLGVGRIEDAVDRTRRAMSLSPFGPNVILWGNLNIGLIQLGRYDEAREVARQHMGAWKPWFLALADMAEGKWASAESIAVANLDERAMQADLPGAFPYARSVARFARGSLGDAVADMSGAMAAARAGGDPAGDDIFRRAAILLADVSGGLSPLPAEAGARDTALFEVMTRGLRASVAGDVALTRTCLATVRRNPPSRFAVVGVSPAVLEGRASLLEGRPEDAIRLLRPLAALRVEPGLPMNGLGLNWARWVLADAFERTSRPDSAAACLEHALVAPSVMSDAIQRPFMRHRLVGLYARMGRLPDAERHLVALEKDWDRPDPEVRRLLQQDRALVRGARGVAGPERARS